MSQWYKCKCTVCGHEVQQNERRLTFKNPKGLTGLPKRGLKIKKYVPKDSENSVFFRLAKYIKETVEKDPDFGELKSITISPCFDNIAEIKMEFV